MPLKMWRRGNIRTTTDGRKLPFGYGARIKWVSLIYSHVELFTGIVYNFNGSIKRLVVAADNGVDYTIDHDTTVQFQGYATTEEMLTHSNMLIRNILEEDGGIVGKMPLPIPP